MSPQTGSSPPMIAPPLDHSLLSVIVPIYNEEDTLAELESRLPPAVADLGFGALEFILVSDGSRDRSEEIICEIVRRDPRFRGVFLTRNFGHQAAVSTGLTYARGSVVAIIDGDLQDPPEVIPELVETLERGADVAYAVREKRKENVLKRSAYSLFYRLLGAISSIDIPLDTGDFCCMRRRVVDAMLALPERNRFVRGLRAWVGFRQVGVAYERAARFAGAPKYTLRKLLALAYDGLFSFTNLPVRAIQAIGFILSVASLLIALNYLIWYFIAPERFPQGFASLIISIWFFGGVQLFCLGIVGEYVVRTHDEGKGRPSALVREVVEAGTPPANYRRLAAVEHPEPAAPFASNGGGRDDGS
jgi:polyisoprenyl-phosphate glycosyltransferase